MGEVSLSDLEVKSVSVNDLSAMKIEFDVILDAEIEVAEGDYHYDDSDLCHQWFLLRCSGNLDCNLNDFEITGINIQEELFVDIVVVHLEERHGIPQMKTLEEKFGCAAISIK